LRECFSWLAANAEFDAGPGRYVKAVLLNPRAAALNENNQHNHKQHAGNNADNRGTVHVRIPLLIKNISRI
jgi:hypothetical protein